MSERIGRNSRKLPGQPWSKRIGIASIRVENRATKWILNVAGPSETGSVKCGNVFIRSSQARLFLARQYLLRFDLIGLRWSKGVPVEILDPVSFGICEPLVRDAELSIFLEAFECWGGDS